MGKTSNTSKDKYNSKTYDDIRLRVSKGKKEQVRLIAEAKGESLNRFITNLIDKAIADSGELENLR